MLSGLAAGVSVEGPIASVSVRLRFEGGARCADDDGAGSVVPDGVISEAIGAEISAGAADWVPEGLALLSAGAGVDAASDGASVRISTGLDDSVSCVFSGREPAAAAACCGVLCGCVAVAVAGWPVTEAIATPSHAGCGDRSRGTPVSRQDQAQAMLG